MDRAPNSDTYLANALPPDRFRSRGGRPRNRSLDGAIRRATLQLIEDVGYHRLTMDAVASTARVGKATIYRRWRSKEDLLVTLIDEVSRDLQAVPDTGSLRRDLQAFLASLVDVLNSPGGRAGRALLVVLPSEPGLAEAYRRGPMARWSAAYGQVFDRAAARGEVAPGAAASLAAEAGAALLLQRWLLATLPLDRAVVDEVVDEVMMPLLTRPGAGLPG
jgi:AcrR family transcriptional regulator